MNKIGIITLNDNNNYGNRLQNYAVQITVERLNLKCETIVNIANMKKTKNRIKNVIKKVMKKRYRAFLNFNKNIKESKKKIDNGNIYGEIKGLNKLYDCFVVGSDQVWNPTLKRFSIGELLIFASPEKRISFSASFGINELHKEYRKTFENELIKFKSISVREETGKKIVEDLTGRADVEVLVDPTMLLTAQEWDKVSKRPEQLNSLKSEKYILNYFLGELPEEWKNEIDRIATENNCEVINILDKKNPFYQTGPSEFLYLEKNAFMVCTDSFHSSVFSIIYDTPFVVFDRQQKGLVSMNSRIDTLLSKFKLQDRRYNGKITDELLKCDYSEAKKILEKEKQKSMNFLKRALDIKE